jgi:DNA repair photolyase
MILKEIKAKAILSKSQVYTYTINPYVGCGVACMYCYAKFMKRFTGHKEPWGEFVDIKINAPELLKKEIQNKKPARVWMSGVCDPYQPAEQKYQITRKCLEILLANNWPVTIQTKSALVLRDIDLFKNSKKLEIGFSIGTADEKIRKIFEPYASPIKARIDALEKLHNEGIDTFAMIAPILPGVEHLPKQLAGKINSVLIDRLNYHYANSTYKKYGLEYAQTDEFFMEKKKELLASFKKLGIDCKSIF